jgi:hypothetical protein
MSKRDQSLEMLLPEALSPKTAAASGARGVVTDDNFTHQQFNVDSTSQSVAISMITI